MPKPSSRIRWSYLPATRRGVALGAALAMIALGAAVLPALVPQAASRSGAVSVAAQGAEWSLVGAWSLPPLDALPLDVAIGPEGRMVVADAQRRRLMVYAPDGTSVATWQTGDPPIALAWGAWEAGPRLFALTFGAQGLRLETRDEGGTLLRTDRLRERLVSDDTQRAFDLSVEGDGATLVLLNNASTQRVGLGQDEAFTVDSRDHELEEKGLRLAVFSNTLQALAEPTRRRVVVRAGARPVFERVFPDAVPLDVAADPTDPDRLHVLLRTAIGAAQATLDSRGDVLMRRDLDPSDVAPPVDPDFRWSLGIGADAAVLTSGVARTAAHRVAPGGGVVRVAYGRVPEAFALSDLPRRANLLSRGNALSLAPAGAAEPADVRILDGAGARVLRMAADGTWAGETIVPYDAVDFAGNDDRIYLSTMGGRVRRFPADVPAASPLDPWSLVCDCELGGRLGLLDDMLHISKPAAREVAVVDAASGAERGSLSVPGAVGLWPADVVAGPDGRLWTADLVTGQVEGWRDAAAPEVTWRAGLLAGPRRLAASRLADGTPVVAALLADGAVELHEADGGALLSRWQPRRADGTAYAAEDIAFDRAGRLWLAEGATRMVRVYEPGEIVTPTPGGPPPPTPTPSAKACRVDGDKVAAPRRLVLGETARVTLTLEADCPQRETIVGADIVLVLDRSSSMDGDPLRAAQQAARTFTELLDTRFHRVGLVSYSTRAALDVPLTDDVLAVVRGIDGLQALGETDIGAALETAADHLRQARRPDVLPVIVLLTDGQHTGPPPDPVAVADGLKSEGVQIYTVGLGAGVARDALERIASTQDRFFFAPTPFELFPIYREILRLVVSSGTVGNLIVDDRLHADVAYEPASAAPRALESPGRLRWSRASLPPAGLTLTFAVRPQRAGTVPVSELAEATFTDNDGVPRSFVFPVPELEVIAPTPTPTPIFDLWLPIAYREHCLPAVERADVVLLIDTSSSMTGEKLDQARSAARGFLGLLQLPGDQAAVIAFDERVRVLTPLTDDRDALEAGLDALSIGNGTRIDRALRAARDELQGPRRKPGNRPVVVLVSDGGQSGAPEAVAPAAEALRATGAEVFTVGLGPDADRALLRSIAGPERFFFAPTPAELQAIYQQVAGRTVCR